MFGSRCVLALALVALAIPALASADPGALKGVLTPTLVGSLADDLLQGGPGAPGVDHVMADRSDRVKRCEFVKARRVKRRR